MTDANERYERAARKLFGADGRAAADALTGAIWFYDWDSDERELHFRRWDWRPEATFRDFVDLELDADEVARFDTGDINPGAEYHDEFLAGLIDPDEEARAVFYRRGNELPRYWPENLGFSDCQCSVCGETGESKYATDAYGNPPRLLRDLPAPAEDDD